MPKPNTTDLAALVARIEVLEAELLGARAELARKDQIIAALQKKLFGSSSERIDPDQLELLLGEDVLGLPCPQGIQASEAILQSRA